MTRVLDIVSRNMFSVPVQPVAVAKGASTQVLADTLQSQDSAEIAIIQLQNVGGSACYYNYGADCDNVGNFVGYIPVYGAVNIFTRQAVNVYAPDGATVIAVLKIKRDEMVQNKAPFVK